MPKLTNAERRRACKTRKQARLDHERILADELPEHDSVKAWQPDDRPHTPDFLKSHDWVSCPPKPMGSVRAQGETMRDRGVSRDGKWDATQQMYVSRSNA